MDETNFSGMGDDLVRSVRSRFKVFLEENKEVDDFVVQIGRRYAARTAQYHLAKTEEDREEALSALRRVRNTLDLELDAIAHLAGSELFSQLRAALGVVVDFAVQSLPTIAKLVRR